MNIDLCKNCKNKEVIDGIVGCFYMGADCQNGEMHEAVTNADRIRAMSDEELAAFLYDDGEAMCKDQRRCSERGCKDCILDWLRQPVKDGEDE